MKLVFGAAIRTCGIVEAAAVASMIGAGVSSYSAVKSGESQKHAAEYNAEMQQAQAKDALQRGAIEAATKKDAARKIASSQVTTFGASGLDAGFGTPLALLTETAGFGELDSLRTINNAKRTAWGYKAQADLDLYQGKMAQRGGVMNAAGTFLNSAGSAGMSYYSTKSKIT
jgi:hypothetical protein